MKTCSESLLLMLNMAYFALPVLEAQDIKVLPEVTGYLGEDATLPCNFIQGPNFNNITQFRWDVLSPEGNRTLLIIVSSQFGEVIHESPLKGRLETKGQSLIIKNVQKTDAGSYICSISTFPSGSHEATTVLIVQEKKEQMAILPRMIGVGVFLLVVVVMLVTTHIIIIRIRRFGCPTCLSATDGPEMCN